MPATDSLSQEQDYLSRARADLARMRERTLSLDVRAGGDALSAEFLAATLYHREQSLIDDPGTTLFFGRTDHADGARWYIGRRHVADPGGDPVVIDWRADVARAFYRASRTEPMGVVRRRRFGVERGAITAYEDEHLTDASEHAGRSAILAHEIERPRMGPMRDIVATIQPEQDVIVRAGIDTSVCIQGAPGTGKTAVGLHRAAWLLYAYRQRLERTGVLVIGPNDSFLEHVGAVLPSLGEAQVRHSTVQDLVLRPDGYGQPRYKVRGVDTVALAGLKGDIRLAAVLSDAVWAHVRAAPDALVVPRGSRRWRVPAHEVDEITTELRGRGVRYLAAREMLPQRLAHAILLRMEDAGDSPDDRVQDAVARSREIKKYVDAVWPAVAPEAVLYQLYCDPPAEFSALRWENPPRTPGSARWTAADSVLLDEIADVLRRPASLGHVVLDEAQDLSPMQLRAVGRRVAAGSLTVLGDIAQGTTPWATESWTDTMDHLGRPDAVLDVLDRGFRVPAAVIAYAARLLPAIAPGMPAPTSVRDNPGSLAVLESPDLWTTLAAATADALGREGSVGVIVPDAWAARAAAHLPSDDRLTVLPATTAKGLEYDHVLVLEPTRIADDEPDERTGLRRLYVVLTRAVTSLTVVHHEPLPDLLS